MGACVRAGGLWAGRWGRGGGCGANSVCRFQDMSNIILLDGFVHSTPMSSFKRDHPKTVFYM